MVGEQYKQSMVLVAVNQGSKVFLVRRKGKPYAGFWSLPGARVPTNKGIIETAREICRNQLNTELKEAGVAAIIDARVFNEEPGRSWMLFLVRAKTEPLLKDISGWKQWWDIKDLPTGLIPSDDWMLKHCLNGKGEFWELVLKEENGSLVGIQAQQW